MLVQRVVGTHAVYIWELDVLSPFVTGTCALVIVSLQAPWPFGTGKIIKAHADGRLDVQWLGNGTSSVRNALH
jgi:hypothetical protein